MLTAAAAATTASNGPSASTSTVTTDSSTAVAAYDTASRVPRDIPAPTSPMNGAANAAGR